MVRASKKSKAAAVAATTRTIRLNVALAPVVHSTLSVHASMTGKTQAEIVTELIKTHLRDYQVRDMTGGSGRASVVDSEADADLIGAAA
jgi:hypothetical protein